MTGRRVGTSRWYSKKPVTLPMRHLRRTAALHYEQRDLILLLGSLHAEHPLVLVREHLHEFRKHVLEVLQDPASTRALREFGVTQDQVAHQLNLGRNLQRF